MSRNGTVQINKRPFGAVVRDALIERGLVTAMGNPNWAAFVAANPTYRVADDALSFIIADQPGLFTITNVQLGKGPAGGAKP